MDFGEALTEDEADKFQEFLEENNLKEGIEFNFHDLAKIMAYSYHNWLMIHHNLHFLINQKAISKCPFLICYT